jgi:triacylglycerol lipase
MAQHVIVLAHGVLGFGNFLGVSPFVNYFNGVAAHLEKSGHVVLVPTVNPVGPVAQRGDELAARILGQAPATARLHLIAHSMGGLDARHALTHFPALARRVDTLVTIGTPHRGSPVADAINRRTDPLLSHIPTLIVEALRQNAGALHDLTTDVCARFDDTTPDLPGVRYINLAGNAASGSHELLLFELAAEIGRLTNEVNDGVVTRTSALRAHNEHLQDWPVDHAGEVGWSKDALLSTVAPFFAPPAPHLARYDAIVNMLS